MATDDSNARRQSLINAIAACKANAEELLSGAEAILKTPRLAFHLAVLAIEEIGKSRILGMQRVTLDHDREFPPAIARALDDHVRKLFWALWAPTFTNQLITKEHIEEYIGLSKSLYEKHLMSLYVDVTATGDLSVPMDAIPYEEAENLIKFGRVILQMASLEHEPDQLSEEARERQRWFFGVTDDPETRGFIMSDVSRQKLKELGSVPAWADWLKAQIENSEAAGRAALDRELARKPDSRENRKPKWRATIRLFSLSHTVNQKPLNSLNEGLHWIQLRSVSQKNGEIQIDLDLGSDVVLEHAYKNLLLLSRLVTMALNVGSIGYFWFHPPLDRDPKQSGKFFERLVDLEHNMQPRIHRNPSRSLDFGPQRRALGKADLNRWVMCMTQLMRFRDQAAVDAFERYLDGLGLIARTDAHMGFEIQSVCAFYLSLTQAMKRFGDCVADESVDAAIRRFRDQSFSSLDEPHLERLLAVGASINSGRPAPHAMDMNDALVMKTLCDVYFIKTFERLAKEDAGG